MVNALFTPCDALRKLPRISKPSLWLPDPAVARTVLGLPPPPQRDDQPPPAPGTGHWPGWEPWGAQRRGDHSPAARGASSPCRGPQRGAGDTAVPTAATKALHRERWGGPATPRAVWASGPGSLARKMLNGVCCKAPIHSSPVLPKAERETISVSSANRKKAFCYTHKTASKLPSINSSVNILLLLLTCFCSVFPIIVMLNDKIMLQRRRKYLFFPNSAQGRIKPGVKLRNTSEGTGQKGQSPGTPARPARPHQTPGD